MDIYEQRVCSFANQSATFQQYRPDKKAARFVVLHVDGWCRVDPWLPVHNHVPAYWNWKKVKAA